MEPAAALERIGYLLDRAREKSYRVRAYLRAAETIKALPPGELEERIARGTVVVLDVRPEREYAAGHIAGARSIPIDELDDAVATLPRREIVAYCRGPYCVYADDAVRLLRERGLNARRLDIGYPEWRREGRRVAATA